MPRKRKNISKNTSLRFDFQKAAAQAVTDHPALEKNTIFINAATGKKLAHPDVLEHLYDDDDALEDVQDTMRDAKKGKTSFFQPIDTFGKKLRTVVFHSDRHHLYDPADRDIDDAATFDHETGHALAQSAHGTLGENTADAYALLQHLKRRKGDAGDIDYCGWKRAAIAVFSGTSSHMTGFTVDKILMDNDSADFLSLTPKETIALAKKYAKKHTRNEKDLKRLRDAFKPLKGKKPTAASFRKIAEITLKAKTDSDVFYVGARILMTPLSQSSVMLDGKKIALKGKEWDKIRSALEEKITALPKNHPLHKTAVPRKVMQQRAP